VKPGKRKQAKLTQGQLRKIGDRIRLLILDVDGVLTDGGITIDDEGHESKTFHVRDGHGIKMVRRAGVHVAIITGRMSKVVDIRAKELGIREVYQRCHIKSVAYEHILEKLDISEDEVAYIGDDIVDIPLFRRVGLSIAVADASPEARTDAMMVTKNRGGRGAVREVTDFLLRSKGLLAGMIDEYRKA